jgi:hypothetical protein
MNDGERDQWVQNDEGLYRWWLSSGQGISSFIRANRAEIDRYIAAALAPRRPR